MRLGELGHARHRTRDQLDRIFVPPALMRDNTQKI
jgi:hypothetical protein